MIKLLQARLFATRFPLCRPFRFGVVELNALEHLVVAGEFDIDGRTVPGFAGENLAPRWFVKDLSRSIEAEIGLMRGAVRRVTDDAARLSGASTPFDFWWQLHQHVRGDDLVSPPLLAQLAESLLERSALDAWCRSQRISISDAIVGDRLGFRPEAVHPGLTKPRFGIPATTLPIRHTVGLADRLETLAATLRENGYHRLKVKLCGDPDADARRASEILDRCAADAWSVDRLTLDGNENYGSIESFERLLEQLKARGRLAAVTWIEQPFHRDIALDDSVGRMLNRVECPPMIIDESDASPADLPRALTLGYAGATHKNCKGVFKSLLHAAVLRDRRTRTGKPCIFSGEDLTIVAPWAMASDLQVASAVGVVDIERNGHHYANGLSGFDSAVGDQAVRDYPGLYERTKDGRVVLCIVDGAVEVPLHSFNPPAVDSFVELT